MDQALYEVVNYILNQATSAELEVIAAALQRRREDSRGKHSSPMGMARSMASRVQEQLGKALDVGNISRKIVADMVRKKQPGISDKELETLLDNWLPSSAADSGKPRELPPDVLVSMVAQYVGARQGSLSAEERRELPEDWERRYRDAFPPTVRRLIARFLAGEMDEVAFWEGVLGGLGDSPTAH